MMARRSSLGQRMQEEEQCAALNLSDTAATSQDGLYLEGLRVGSAIFRMQVAEGCEFQYNVFFCVLLCALPWK